MLRYSAKNEGRRRPAAGASKGDNRFMESFLHSLSAVGIVLLLTAIGYFCAMRGWFNPVSKAFLSKYLMNIAAPAMLVYAIRGNFSREILAGVGPLLLAPALCTVLLFALSFLAGRLLRIPKGRLSVFVVLCSLSNALFIGRAICIELFGEESNFYALLYYLVNMIFLQFLGVGLIYASGTGKGRSWKDALLSFLKTPAVPAVLIGYLLLLLDWNPPSIVMTTLRYVNETMTPMALLLTGGIMHELGLRGLRIDRDMGVMLVFRFLISPALALLTCTLFGITGLGRDVQIVEAAMPTVTMAVIAASEYGADDQFAAEGASVSTLAGFVVIPILMLFLR